MSDTKTPFDWAVVTAAAQEWMTTKKGPPAALYVPMDTSADICELASEMYDVPVEYWPVKSPLFGFDPPTDLAVPFLSMSNAVATVRGERTNTSGLPFPILADNRQRAWQFEFVDPAECRARVNWWNRGSDEMARQLLLWALTQPHHWSGSVSALENIWSEWTQSRFTGDDARYISHCMQEKLNNAQRAGRLWVVTNHRSAVSRYINPAIESYIRPVMVTRDSIANGGVRGQQWKKGDRIFYFGWNPTDLLSSLPPLRIPETLIPWHQISPLARCNCFVCTNNGFTASSWNTIDLNVQESGRLSELDPFAQGFPKMGGGVLDIGVKLDAEARNQYQLFSEWFAAGLLSAQQVRRLIDITES